MRASRLFLNRLNVILVAIVKQEWPDDWPNFIPDIVNSSKVRVPPPLPPYGNGLLAAPSHSMALRPPHT